MHAVYWPQNVPVIYIEVLVPAFARDLSVTGAWMALLKKMHYVGASLLNNNN